MKTKTLTPTIDLEIHRVEMVCSGPSYINIEFTNSTLAKEFYDYHKNFMLFLNQPIKTITLVK
jgi:hypothetical protein